MKKKMTLGFLLCLMAFAVSGFAALQQQAQQDSMKHDDMKHEDMKKDDMKKDEMSHDSMSKDKKMSHDMAKATVLKGWVSDSECAAHGVKNCSNKDHVAQGAKLVLVTDGDNKVWTVTNPQAIAEHQGHHVQVKATADAEKGTVNVQEVKMLKGK